MKFNKFIERKVKYFQTGEVDKGGWNGFDLIVLKIKVLNICIEIYLFWKFFDLAFGKVEIQRQHSEKDNQNIIYYEGAFLFETYSLQFLQLC